MLRSTAILTTAFFAVTSQAQTNVITRTDSANDVATLTFRTQSRTSVSPSAANVVLPDPSLPTYTYGYAITAPTVGARRPIVGSDLFNRTFYGAHNIEMGFTGTANGHSFQLPNDAPFGLTGPVQFVARYNSSGLFQRDVLFTGAPTAQVSGPTANLSATLTQTRIGRFNEPRFRVTGFFLDQNGINNVNLISPLGGIIFNTFMAPSATTFTMPVARLTVPRNRLTVPPRTTTSTEFRASYQLRLQ